MPAKNPVPAAGEDAGASGGTGAGAPQWDDENVGRLLGHTAKAARAFHSERVAEVGATFGMWTILATLHATGPLIQRELAERLRIEGPTLTRHLVRMETGGLIRRQQSASDRRAALVALTGAGNRLYERLAEIARGSNAQLLQGFSPDEVGRLRDMLTRIQENIGRAMARGAAGAVDESD